MHLSAMAFKAQEAIIIADKNTTIVNPSFTRITDYSEQEAIGSPTALLQSGCHGQDFYQLMWREISSHGYWQGEILNRKKRPNFPQWQTITTIKGPTGKTSHYVACFHDIFERKRAEENIYQLAHSNELTHLPNRHMLYQRREQALATAIAHRCHLSVPLICA